MKKTNLASVILILAITSLLLPVIPIIALKQSTHSSLPNELLVPRTWNDLDLLYTNKFHSPAEVLEEITHFAQQAPEIVEITTIGKSIQIIDFIQQHAGTVANYGLL